MNATTASRVAARLEREVGSAEVTRGGQTMNPVTLVTPTVRRPAPNYLVTNNERSAVNGIVFQPLDTRDRSNSEVAMSTITSPEKGRKEGQLAMKQLAMN